MCKVSNDAIAGTSNLPSGFFLRLNQKRTLMTYSEKLKDPRWQKKRLKILNRDEWMCFWCGDDKNILHVHHETYIGDNPWDTPDDFLITLCDDCHSVEHLQFTELERHLLFCVRSRDRLKTEMIKLNNRVVKRMKGVFIEESLTQETPF